jgi:toxin-antitoxin system PIN domain toxin
MKKLLDINTWIALSLETHPQHKAARQWYNRTLIEPGELLLCRQTEMGFLRLTTQDRVMKACGVQALTNNEAINFLAEVSGDPAVSSTDEPASTRHLWQKLSRSRQRSPNVWVDAYLAALAISLGAEMVTFDQGFKSYLPHGLRLVLLNP